MDTTEVLYATLPRRIKAAIVDGVVLLTLMILSPLALSLLVGGDSSANAVVMYIPPLLLEPLLVTCLGFTFGQYLLGIQVVRVNTGGKCPLSVSLVRYFAKTVLGSLSMIHMLFSKRHQALHDHLAKTIVVLSPKRIEQNADFATKGEKEQNLAADVSYHYPSVLRRIVTFGLWYLASSFFLMLLVECTALVLVPEYTLETEKLPVLYDAMLNVLSAVLFIWLAVSASKGNLVGARRKAKGHESR